MLLNIRTVEETELDLLSLGEAMIRLSPPGHGRIEFADQLEVWVGGGEYNVAYAAARFGLRAGFVSRLVDNPLGHLVLNHARAAGMDTSEVGVIPYDGVGRTSRIGLNFTEVGSGPRSSVTLYDRGHSAASQIRPGNIDFQRICSERGVRWLHTGGVFAALSEDCAATCKEALIAARGVGTVVSYDLNYRSTLWSIEQAQDVTKELMPYVDCLIGNEEQFRTLLGVESGGSGDPPSVIVARAYPNVKVVGSTLRETKSSSINDWSAVLYVDGKFYESRRYDGLEIEDRVGGGDGFSSGIAYGFLTGMEAQDTVEFGAAHGALLHTTRGDTSQVKVNEVIEVMRGGSPRIKR